MCTVTFIPRGFDDFVLTSNRDEAPNRETLAPAIYKIDDTQLLFPKDAVAGGTWIGLSERKRLICLLNGGFTAHERQEAYRMSRGVIVTDLLTSEDAVAAIKTYDFHDIEPFTIILVDWEKELKLYELVWDGVNSHLEEKPIAPAIWSSSLLYAETVKKKRESWFSEFLFKEMRPSEASILKFHKSAGEGDLETNLIMDRGFVKTKSVTQIQKNTEITSMRYEDIAQQTVSLHSL